MIGRKENNLKYNKSEL